VPLADAGAAERRMFVRGLTLDCSIGVHSHERGADQRVRIDIELTVRDDKPVADSIANVISYDDVVAGVKAVAAAGHINLVDTLAERIAASCLSDRRVVGARVRVEKLGAIAEAAGVGVEIERFAAER
jgi:dihydroneopterin aldolase